MAPARREFDRLPISVAAAILETLDAIAESPMRLGKPLMLEHEGRYSARRGPYRIIFEIEEDDRLVRMVAIGHRRDVYRRRRRNDPGAAVSGG
jgi:mRNA interferase RelE/StbE